MATQTGNMARFEVENVDEPVTAQSGVGTARALAEAAEDSEINLVKVHQFDDKIEVRTAGFGDPGDACPDEIHEVVTEWGYAHTTLGIDGHTDAAACHVYRKR